MSGPYFDGPARPVIAVADAAALRAVASNLFKEAQLARIAEFGLYEWKPASGSADDGVTVIKPNDRVFPLILGRWILVQMGETAPRVVVAGAQQVASTGYQLVSSFTFNAADYSGASFTLAAMLRTTSALVTAQLRLYNLTDLVVVGADPLLTSTSPDPELKTVALASPADLPAGLRTYELQLKKSAAGVDVVTCDKAELLIG